MAGLRDLQQGGNCHRKTWINILVGILQLILTYAEQRGAQLQALSHMSGVVEVWQAEEAELLVPPQAEEEHNQDGLPQEQSSPFCMGGSGRTLHFKPAVLDFGTQLLGLARAEAVYVHNPSPDAAVTLLSVFTSSAHIHSPPFHKRVIPPRGKTSFKLIFLPTEEGNVETSLFINTSSHGLLSYQVFGVGVQPGAQTTSHMKAGVLLFPHIHSIKLTQTQEDASNITLLGLLLEGRIPENTYRPSAHQGSCFATETLAVQISLSERGERRTDLVRLKPYVIENIMVLFVMSSGGSGSREPSISIYMLNSGAEKLFVKDMQLLSDVESSLKFKQIPLKDSATNFTQVATLVCRGSGAAPEAQCPTHIGLKVLRNATLKPHPAFAHTDRGFGSDPSTLIHVTPRQSGRHLVDLWLTSSFEFSFSVNDASVPQDMEGVLTVTNFSRPVTVPWGCWRLLSLKLHHRKLPVNLMTTVVLVTSIGLSLEIPLRVRSGSKQGDVMLETSAECGKPCPLRLSDAGRVQWQQTLLDVSSSWRVDSSLAAELCSRWRNNKDQPTCSWPRLPVETSSPLDFGATPVNERKVKYFQLKNPSGSPVSLEVRVLSSYTAPLDALDLLTKWFNISPLSVNVTTGEFALLQADGQESQDGGVRLLLLPQETKEVGVAFTATEHRPVTSLILIRNNLTVLDVVTVRGHGARELLRIGGRLPGPGASLRFNVPQATLMECRERHRSERPRLSIRKSFKVENAGELPLTVVSMTINGYKCQGYGFEVLQCRPFLLDHNSSSEINIAFVPDFTSSWVIRDLALVTERGSSFLFTLNVTLPHHMLPLCAQVVPGPTWEEAFWLITLIFTCCSLGGVYFMAFHQAQYILSEFTAPSPRTNHSSALSRDNSPSSPVCHNGVSKAKGSCKTFVDACNTSDKGKGRGSLAVAGGPARSQPSRKSSGGAGQAQKKHKVSLYYGKHKGAPPAPAAASEEREEPVPDPAVEPVPDACSHHHDDGDGLAPELAARPPALPHFPQTERGPPAPVMFPMETHSGLPDGVAAAPGCGASRAAPRFADIKRHEKRDSETAQGSKLKDCEAQRLSETAEQEVLVSSHKGKKCAGKGPRRSGEDASGVSERGVAVLPDRNRDPEWKENRNANRNRNRCSSGKPDAPKCAPHVDGPVKQLQNGVCPPRPRRKGTERRHQCESGSDSGSSSGSVRASRGSWGSWSSASSLEGEKDPSAGARHPCTGPSRPRDNIQYSVHPAERDCYQTFNSSYKTQSPASTHTLYRKDPGAPDPAPTSSFTPSFAAVAAGVERNMDLPCTYLTEEAWSALSVPLTNEFRYNTTEPLPFAPQGPSSSYNGFPWSSASNPCTSSYPYSEQSNYVPGGSRNFQNSLSCQENQNVTYSSQSSWGEDSAPEMPSAWDGTGCLGSKGSWGPPGQVCQRSPTLVPEGRKGFFSGTRSLSPMSSLFGSIWTPQSAPYQNHFQRERSLPPSPQSPYSPEPPGACRPGNFSSFNPFGPHMNLDIWNSSSNRSSNSQLSNDSGYCGDV